MASRRETRLPGGNNALADATIELNDPVIGGIDQAELMQIFAAQPGDTTQAHTNTMSERPPRVLIETDFALESFQRAYEAQLEAARVSGTLKYCTSGPRKRLRKFPKNAMPGASHSFPLESIGTGPTNSRSALGDLLPTPVREAQPPNGKDTHTQDVVPSLDREVTIESPTFGNLSSTQANDSELTRTTGHEESQSAAGRPPERASYHGLDGTDEHQIDEHFVNRGPRHFSDSQAMPSSRAGESGSTQDDHRSHFPTQIASFDDYSTDPANFAPSRRSAFEDHTRFERNFSRASNQDTSFRNTIAVHSPGSPRRSRKKSNGPSESSDPIVGSTHQSNRLGYGVGLSEREFGLLGIDDHPPKPPSYDEARASVTGQNTYDSTDLSQHITTATIAPKEDFANDAAYNMLAPQNLSVSSTHRTYLQNQVEAGGLIAFDYSLINPEVLSSDYTNTTYLQSGEEKRKNQLKHLAHRVSSVTADSVNQLAQSGQLQNVLDLAKTAWPMFPRAFAPQQLHKSPNAPPICHPKSDGDAWPADIPMDLLEYIATNFLSHTDVRNLRLVNKLMCADFSPIYFRNLVTRFGLGMFAPSQRFGDSVSKFGISFEVDLPSLYRAKRKVSHEKQESWWGNYTWPKPAYQRFPELEALEELVDDNKPLLKKTLQNLPTASELALSIDSGHGWLNGPDMSDMQIWDLRNNGSRVFGKSFKSADRWEEHLRNEVFRWAQQNTINQSTKYLVERSTTEGSGAFNRTRKRLGWLQSVRILDCTSYELESDQTDHHECHHTGGPPRPTPNQNPAVAHQMGQLGVAVANAFAHVAANAAAQAAANTANNSTQALLHALQPPPPPPPPPSPPAPAPGAAGAWQAQLQVQPIVQNIPQPGVRIPPQPQSILSVQPIPRPRRLRPERLRTSSPRRVRGLHAPQWPLIFNGYNVAAELGGQNSYIQDKLANPASSPLKPGQLSEAQAQWLMETFWAQRAFLSAYTTSIILNKTNLKSVHALNIAKLSSGLLPLLEQHEFWRALPGLTNLTIMVSPDWRQEHIPGDQSYQTNMLISPLNASVKLASFLKRFICGLENLSKLTIGFVGGGEHATGMLARNQHVLPAPITEQPRSWISDHHTKPNPESMISFNHIKDLKFENCWFSPCMLLAFMDKSRDTSLRHLTLDSVSLTAHPAPGSNGVAAAIETQYGTEAWLNETLPNKGCWPALLDAMTPGITFLEQKQALGFHLSEESARLIREKAFRGNVKEITLRSCGYVHVSGVMVEELNQSELLRAQPGSLDDGLVARKQALQAGQAAPRSRRLRPAQQVGNNGNGNPLPVPVVDSRPGTPQDISSRLMMSTNDAQGHEYFGLGTLTQAVHPVEKRVLEQAWGMRFGWGDDLARWSAVDDGFYEGGTGRFSGSVLKGS